MDYPKTLYKYSKFKPYTIENLEKGYVYFCPAYELDDQFECLINWRKYQGLYRERKIDVAIEVVEDLLRYYGFNIPNVHIKDYYNGCDLNKEKALKYMIFNSNINRDKAKRIVKGIEELQNLKLSEEAEEKLRKVVLMQDYVGIVSLAEENNNQVLWSMYANNYNGYCIEYDIETFLSNNPEYEQEFFKVKYDSDRQFDVIKEILRIVYKGIFVKLGVKIDNKLDDKLKQLIIDIATTKHTDWSFQREWRLVGKPENKDLILPIKAVYLGCNLRKTYREKILRVCRKRKIKVYYQTNDYETLQISFENK